MRVLLHLFGREILDLNFNPVVESGGDRGEVTTYPIGFTHPVLAPFEDPGRDYGYGE